MYDPKQTRQLGNTRKRVLYLFDKERIRNSFKGVTGGLDPVNLDVEECNISDEFINEQKQQAQSEQAQQFERQLMEQRCANEALQQQLQQQQQMFAQQQQMMANMQAFMANFQNGPPKQ